MRYRDITADVSNRFRLSSSHPVLATITIDPADWYDFQRLNADNPATSILGRDTPSDSRMIVYVGCASAAVRDRLEAGWG